MEMSKLKESFESLGYTEVVTYINSGNVIFETTVTDEERIVTKVEKAIQKEFALDIRVVARSAKISKL